MEKKFVPVQFEVNGKVVTASKYVPHALYVQNKAVVEALGGEILKGEGGFVAKFAKVANAKSFVKQAITEMSAKEYAATRKTEPKSKKARQSKPARQSKKSATPAPAKKRNTKVVPRKSKKSAEITPEQKKMIEALNIKVLNRAAAAYDRANGGTGTVTFDKLGKSKAEIKAYIPAGIASLRKSKHWAKAEAVGVTEDMLG